MSVFRIKKTDNFSVIPNDGLRDKKMSAKAKGLWAMMLTYPNDWEFSIDFLIESGTDGRESIRAGLKELESLGYLTKEPIRDKGKFMGFDYVVYESPQTEKPFTEKPTSEKPFTEKPTSEKPITENRPQRNTDNNSITNITKNCNNEYTPHTPQDFEEFWSHYPKKKDKANAHKCFKKVDVPVEVLIDAIERQKKSADWLKENGRFIPYPSTWLNGRRWEDEADVGFLHGHVHVDGKDPDSYKGETDEKEKLNLWK